MGGAGRGGQTEDGNVAVGPVMFVSSYVIIVNWTLLQASIVKGENVYRHRHYRFGHGMVR